MTYNEWRDDILRWTIHQRCEGCERIDGRTLLDGQAVSTCKTVEKPSSFWTRIGGCPYRTHALKKVVEDDKKLNPLKASKRGVKQVG